jgi:hypothetical protein
MFSSVLSEAKALVDKRFLLTAFFPVLVFSAASSLLVGSANGGLDRWTTTWEGYSGSVQFIIAACAIAAMFVLAMLASVNGLGLIRIYEGYPWWTKPLVSGPKEQQRRKGRTTGDLELLFPHENVRATRLGNVLAAAEDYPNRAYGANTIVTWPRLSLTLDEKGLAPIFSAFDTMQFLVLISQLLLVYGVAGGAYAAAEGLGGLVFLGVAVGSLLLSKLTYQGAVQSAVQYGLHIRSTYDLHRNQLLTQLGFPLPATNEEERRTWALVTEQLRRGHPAPFRYVESSK